MSRLKIKAGVIMAGLKIEMRHVLKVAESIYSKHGQQLTVTSALDGEHSCGSLHYYGYALDFRTRFWDKIEAEQVTTELRNELGQDYFVLFEGDHIHVHYRVLSNA